MQVRKLAKSEDSAVATAAAEVVEAWKTSVKREQATTDGEGLKRASSGPLSHMRKCALNMLISFTTSFVRTLSCFQLSSHYDTRVWDGKFCTETCARCNEQRGAAKLAVV